MAELDGKADFIVPVLIGTIPAIPDFLEHKLYVDLQQKAQSEVVAELYGAILTTPPATPPPVDNLQAKVRSGTASHIAEVVLEATVFAETISFVVKTSVPIRARAFRFEPAQTWAFLSTREAEEDPHLHAIALEGWRLKPGGPRFIIELTFDPGTDAAKVVTFVDRAIFD